MIKIHSLSKLHLRKGKIKRKEYSEPVVDPGFRVPWGTTNKWTKFQQNFSCKIDKKCPCLNKFYGKFIKSLYIQESLVVSSHH